MRLGRDLALHRPLHFAWPGLIAALSKVNIQRTEGEELIDVPLTVELDDNVLLGLERP
jgi:hypothetical protein